MNIQIIRSICVLLIGILFFVFGDSALSMLVVVVGVLLMIPGVWALLSYVRHIRQRPMFPLAALGSFILGLWLAVSPDFFVSFFMYVLGGVLVALGIYQLATLSVSHRILPVAWPFYVLPVSVLLLGLFVIFNPFEAAALPFILIGVGCVISAINDLVIAIRASKEQKSVQHRVEVEVEDVDYE